MAENPSDNTNDEMTGRVSADAASSGSALPGNDAFGDFSGTPVEGFDFMTAEDDGGASGDGVGAGESGGAGDAGEAAPVSRRHRRRMSPQHIRRIKRRRRRKRILIGLGVLLLILVALSAWFGVSAMKTKNELQQAVASASGMQETLLGGDSAKLNAQVSEFSGHVNNAYRQTSSVLWAVAARVPYIGDDITAVRTAVTAMENISSQGLPALTNAIGALGDVTVQNGTVSMPGMTQAAEGLKQADTVIDHANQSVVAAPTPHIQQIAEAMSKAKEYLATVDTTVHNASVFAQIAPSMFSTDGQSRTYLILAQTNSEIRPSGGLPGSWGTMTVTGGKVEMHEFVADTDVTPTWFDQPVIDLTAEERSLFTDKLGRVAQDVNFTPDFPRTGQIASAMWKTRFGTQVDGVIAIDPVFLQNMLAVTGGVTLSDGTVIDGTNTAKFLLSDVYAQKSEDEQDAFFSEAASLAFQHIMDKADDPKAFLKAAVASIEQGHILMWSANADEQKLLEETVISGRLATEASDPQVGVYFSDITQSKMDWYLKREVTSEFDKVAANGANQYTVHIKLTNMMTADQVASTPQYVLGSQLEGIANGQIKTAAFVYAPAGGRLVDWTMSDGSQFDGITVHDGLTLGVKTFLLSPGESYEITVHVQSAPGVQAPIIVRQTPQIEGRTEGK
ncbi:DUF4012 domain-containing protein [Bifidobacterium aerophilum]|uniref:DUF4012 domain-containing protein n=1 Tax=Bifidobacterium aerophilum TaxID=1798155 RepID=A0A6N9Z5T2_9BIFI|nr:DUF4012 domain-containing protein [Bifidobacterium aerophilum]